MTKNLPEIDYGELAINYATRIVEGMDFKDLWAYAIEKMSDSFFKEDSVTPDIDSLVEEIANDFHDAEGLDLNAAIDWIASTGVDRAKAEQLINIFYPPTQG